MLSNLAESASTEGSHSGEERKDASEALSVSESSDAV